MLLTGFVSAGFTVPFVSLLFTLSFMPSAVNRKNRQAEESEKKNEYNNINIYSECLQCSALKKQSHNVTVPRFGEAMNSSTSSSSSESSMRGVKAYLSALKYID